MVVYLLQRSLYNIWFLYIRYCFQPKCLECVKLLFSFQVITLITPQPAKHSSSRFTTPKDIILLSLLSIEISKMQCMAVSLTDPHLVLQVGFMTSIYRTTLRATKIRTPDAALHTPSPPDIQLVTVGFSPEAISSLLLTLKCFTKQVIIH